MRERWRGGAQEGGYQKRGRPGALRRRTPHPPRTRVRWVSWPPPWWRWRGHAPPVHGAGTEGRENAGPRFFRRRRCGATRGARETPWTRIRGARPSIHPRMDALRHHHGLCPSVRRATPGGWGGGAGLPICPPGLTAGHAKKKVPHASGLFCGAQPTHCGVSGPSPGCQMTSLLPLRRAERPHEGR